MKVFRLFLGVFDAIGKRLVDFSKLGELSFFAVPIPLRYGLGFSWSAFLPIVLLYVITAIETIGDTTATSAVSDEPVEGPLYMRRIEGAVRSTHVGEARGAPVSG